MSINLIPPNIAQQKLASGAILIDIREHAEFQREHINGAICLPSDQLQQDLPEKISNHCLIFYCKSGGRTQSLCHQLARLNVDNKCNIYILEGGLIGWKSAGLSVIRNRNVLPITRQVQIAAGSLILLSMLLGAAISPFFYLLASFVGAGLVFAGLSGFCGMAMLLDKMPWNQ
ncbi:membrane protein [Bibersteinia trehalosi Y31]|uniref:Inner membrane protein YgaP n=2 Tax=Bibersteinia trehalosi TaxID=47735 RepID=W0R7E4_BIBTR|nr:rhodanese family protein [Bibersteinia trehalosi]AHG87059.1 Inner membrane protein YgaP [Bibersteinia trehalosi USDA-ARS-USMARC-190]OAQ14339.1 membrane protein [Bibersteinia trehalosi Y31]